MPGGAGGGPVRRYGVSAPAIPGVWPQSPAGGGGGRRGGTLLYNSRYRPRGPGSTFPIKKVTHAVIEPGAAIAKERERTIQDK